MTCEKCGEALALSLYEWFNSVFAAMKRAMRANTSAPISCLLSCRRPSDIAWLVVAVVVDPIERVFQRWSRSNIAQETLEGIAPRPVDHDSSTTVPALIAVATTRQHSNPRFIRRRAVHAMRTKTGAVAAREHFSKKTTATEHAVKPQMRAAHYLSAPARAFTQIATIAVRASAFFVEAKHGQTTARGPSSDWLRIGMQHV